MRPPQNRLRVLVFGLPAGPPPPSEPAAQAVQGFEAAPPTLYVRLEFLSARLRKRTYSRAVSRLHEARRRSGEMLQTPAHLVSPPTHLQGPPRF